MVDQHTLERKLRLDAVVYLSPLTTVEEAFGPMEEWILEIGSNRLLLNPLNGYWIYEDTVHDSWEATGFRAGEVIFCLEGEELAVKPSPGPPPWEEDNRYRLAEELYCRLQNRLSAGSIDRETFASHVGALRFQDWNGSWWQVKEQDGTWLTWDGTAWVEGAPERRRPSSLAESNVRRFAALKDRFFALWRQRDEGKLGPEEFVQEVHSLRLQDEVGTWWQIRASDGAWLKWDGAGWTHTEPRFSV
jgi:hypothetical protein